MLLLCVFACLVEILVAIAMFIMCLMLLMLVVLGVMMSHCYLHMASRQYIDDILLIYFLQASDTPCALFMPTICTHDMLDMISSSTLHLCTTRLLDLITMIACFVASPMFHSYSFSWVDDIYVHALT